MTYSSATHATAIVPEGDAVAPRALRAGFLWTVALFLLVCAVAFAAIGAAPIVRVQESRVLETARQMLSRGPHDWMIPTLNGQPRLNKPPLAYWMAAVAFVVGGVSEGVGRVPFAVLGVATVGIVWWIGRRLFGDFAAAASALGLIGSHFFFKFARLSETDMPATFAVTAAVWLAWRGIEAGKFKSAAVSFHLSAAATAVALLAKGGPAVFPPLFLLGVILIERNWLAARRFLLSGALLTFAAIALPWFVYVYAQHMQSTLVSEMQTNFEGRNHGGWAIQYVLYLLVATAPWSMLVVIAIVAAARRWRGRRELRKILIWMIAIALPLCVTGNVQDHYVLPLIPPAMLLVGWLIDEARRGADAAIWTSRLFDLTVFGLLIAGLAIVPAAHFGRGIQPIDWIASTALIAAAAATLLVRSRPTRYLTGLAAGALIMPLVMSGWLPSLDPTNLRQITRTMTEKLRPGPYAYYGPNPSPTISFYLKQEMAQAATEDEAFELERRIPGVKFVAVSTQKRPVKPLPAPFEQLFSSKRSAEQSVEVYSTQP